MRLPKPSSGDRILVTRVYLSVSTDDGDGTISPSVFKLGRGDVKVYEFVCWRLLANNYLNTHGENKS